VSDAVWDGRMETPPVGLLATEDRLVAVVFSAVGWVKPVGAKPNVEDGNGVVAVRLVSVGPVSETVYEPEDADGDPAADDALAGRVGIGLEESVLSMTVDNPTMIDPVNEPELGDPVVSTLTRLLLLLCAVGEAAVCGKPPVLGCEMASDSDTDDEESCGLGGPITERDEMDA